LQSFLDDMYPERRKRRDIKAAQAAASTSAATSASSAVHERALAVAHTPIDDENVGHRMLRSLGWQGYGNALGETRQNKFALLEPVAVTRRKGKRGLGVAEPTSD
jgi:hypothetical protein